MRLNNRRYAECAIIPLQGRAIFTVPPANELRLTSKPHRQFSFTRSVGLALLVIGFWSFPTVTKASVTVSSVLTATNAQRTEANIAPLRHDSRLDASAKMKADDMFAQQYFAHLSPTGRRGWNWMQDAGYAFTEAGENLAMDFASGSDVVAAWMTSATHRENILNGKYTDVGVAAVSGVLNGKKTTIIVEHFGRQTSSATVAQTQPSLPVVLTQPEPTPQPALAPVAITPTMKLLPSLVNPEGMPIPELAFTYLEPPQIQSEVLGLSTTINDPVPPVPVGADNLGWLILGILGLSASVIGLASVVWPSIYPQPLRRLATTQA